MTYSKTPVALFLAASLGLLGCRLDLGGISFDECAQDIECDNGVFCDGEERCAAGLLGSVCLGARELPCGRFGEHRSCSEMLGQCVDCADDPSAPECSMVDGGVDAGAPPCGSEICDGEEICATIDGGPRCMPSCVLGRDRLHLGSDGRGRGCAAEEACYWAGDPDAIFGGYCAAGNYNDVRVANLGVPCSADQECYSPFGRGRCDGEEGAGVCVVDDCIGLAEIAPGVVLTAPLCPSPAVCGDDQVCRAACATADDCDAGDACGGSPRQCRATCGEDADCRPTERCVDAEDVACPEGAACACEPLPS